MLKKLMMAGLLAVLPMLGHANTTTPTSTLKSEKGLWIDVRTPSEYRLGHLVGSINIPVDDIATQITKVAPNKSTPINLYCRSGRRADVALKTLQGMGYTQVVNHGGYEAVRWVAERVKIVQDILGQRIGLENASYYYRPQDSQMSDSEFISAVVKEADCLLHLDVNNIFVNGQNFAFDPHQYLRQLPLERTCYLHVAGHYVEDDGFIVDTHGSSVIGKVWTLLDDAYSLIYEKTHQTADQIPTCLERDFNFPQIDELLDEVAFIHDLQNTHRQSCLARRIA